MLLRRVTTTAVPVKGGLVEVVGASLFRAKAKRRKAVLAGELAPGNEAQNPFVASDSSGDGMMTKFVNLTRGVLLGSAM